MAEIKSIYAPQVEADLKKVYSELEKHHKLIIEMSKQSIDFYGGRQAGNPADLKNAITGYEELVKKQKELEAQIKKLQEAKRQSNTRTSEEIVNQRALAQNADRQTRANSALVGAYARLNAEHQIAMQRLRDLTVQYGTQHKATVQAQRDFDVLDKKIKEADAAVRVHNRNVGNYASGWNGLSNSINQITRELPAFTFSAQTGLLALSNNIPILTDEIGGLIHKNKELAKQGQPVKSVFSQILGSLFSLQTAMGVGILLFTVYGKEIGNFITGLFKSSNAVKTLSDQFKDLTDAKSKASENSSKEISELDILYRTTQNVSLSISERKKAVEKLQELYPKYLANISDENILNGKSEKQYWKLRDAILAKYTAQAISDKLAENSRDRLDDYMNAQQELINAESRLNKETSGGYAYRKKYFDLDNNGRIIRIKQGAEEHAALRTAIYELNNRTKAEQKISELRKNALKEDSLLINTMHKLTRQSADLNVEKIKDTEQTKTNTTAKKENIKAKEKTIELLKGTESWYNDLLRQLKDEQSTLADSTTQYKIYSDAIAEVEKQLDRLKNGIKGVEIQPIKMPKQGNELEERLKAETDAIIEQNQAQEKAIELMKQRADEILNSFGMDFINNSGLTTFFDLVENGLSQFGDNWEAKTVAIMEATQEMFNFISNLSHAHFAQEYDDLARQKEISIQFAGDSQIAREEIEREYERRRKEIQVREAKAKRNQAMFNIGIDTAQAIMRAWAQNPKTAPIMTAIIGKIGVAQILAIASQPLPQFWKGTDNAPEGFAEVGERGRELIKDGKTGQWRLSEKRTVDYLTKGSTVLTNANTEKVLNFHAFNKGLTNTLVENNIDFYPLENKIDKLTNAILNKESLKIVDDSNGRKYYSEKNGQVKGLNNARLMVKQNIF